METNNNDITLYVGADISDLVRQISFAQKTVGEMGTRLHTGGLGEITTQMNTQARQWGRIIDAEFKDVTAQVDDTAKAVNKARRPFEGWALSVMFFGMAIQRAMDGIWKSSTKTFQDVMHSTDGAVTQFDVLNGSIAYLQFVAGQALEPVVAFILPIVDAVTDWISNNETLFATLVTVGTVIGTFFAVGGIAYLALSGFIDLGVKLGVVMIDAAGKIESVDFGSFGAFLTNPIVIAVVAALAALAAISWKAFSETPEAWKAVKDSVKEIDGPMDRLFKSVEGLVQQLLPNFKISWQDIAWVMAWAIDLGIKQISLFIDSVSALINGLSLLVDAFQVVAKAANLMWDAIWNGISGKSMKTFNDLQSSIKDAADSFKTTLDSVKQIGQDKLDYYATLVAGPEAFKQNAMAAQRAEEQTKQDNIYIERIEMWNQEGLDNAELVNRLFATVIQDMKRNASGGTA